MTQSSNTTGLGQGVYYAADAYAGLLKRFLILGIDLGVIAAIGGVIFLVCAELVESDEDANSAFLASWILAAYVYLVFVEASVGTLGFRMAGMRIVNLKGERPSFVRMTFRLLLWVLGPFHPVVDLIFLSDDPHRQTLRDKVAGTYVIRKDAVPCGEGKIRLCTLFLLGFNIMCTEVQRPQASTST